MYFFLDHFLFYFHLLLTLFNLIAWLWRRTQRIHLVVISLTLFSWLGLGLFYGIGYCPLTDVHWFVRRQLGYDDMPASYVKFMIDSLTSWDVDATLVNRIVAIAMALAFFMSVFVNAKRKKH